MFKIIFANGATWKTPYNCKDDRVGLLPQELRSKIHFLKSEEKLSDYHKFTQKKIDGRTSEAKNLDYFSWKFII